MLYRAAPDRKGRAMIHIEVVGQNSSTSRALAEAATEAAVELGIQANVCLVDNPGEMAQYHRIASTPALLIDGAVVCTGSIASADQIQDMIVWRHPQLRKL